MKLRHHEALRSLPLWLLATAVNASVLVTVTFWVLADAGPEAGAPPSLMPWIVLSWAMLAPYLVLGRTRRRASDFELALPVHARRLWRRHVAAVGLAGALILALTNAVAVAWCVLIGDRFGLLAALDAPRLAALLFTGLVLAVLISGATRRRAGSLPRQVVAAVGVPVLLVGLAAVHPAWTALAAAAVMTLAAVLDRLQPAAFVLDETTPASASPTALSWAPAAGRGGVLILARWLTAGPVLWSNLLFNGIWGAAFLSGLLSVLTGNDALRLYFTPLIAAGTLLITLPWLAQLPAVDPLPVSRRRLFAVVVAAVLGTLVLSYGAGRLVMAVAGLGPPGEGPYLPVVLTLVGLPWLLFLALSLGSRDRRLPYVFLGLALGLCLAVQLVPNLDPDAWLARLGDTLRLLGESALGNACVWAASVLVLAAAYVFAENRFRRAELAARPDWTSRGWT